MARPLRIEYPGAFYHVLQRGLEKRVIFLDRGHYIKFLDIFRDIHLKYKIILHTYCLMPNHYHLLVETPNGNLSKSMQELNARYAQFFNWKNNRVGPLLAGRYKAILVEKESYSLELSRYIHLNPVRAGLANQPEQYEFSSMMGYLDDNKKWGLLETRWLLSQFSQDQEKSKKIHKKYVLDGLMDVEKIPDNEKTKFNIWGSEEFISAVTSKYIKKKQDRSISGLKELQKPKDIKKIQKAVNALNLPEKMKKKVLIYYLRKYTPLSLKEVGCIAGAMSDVAVSQVVSRLENNTKVSLEEIIQEIESTLEKCQM